MPSVTNSYFDETKCKLGRQQIVTEVSIQQVVLTPNMKRSMFPLPVTILQAVATKHTHASLLHKQFVKLTGIMATFILTALAQRSSRSIAAGKFSMG